MENEKRQLIAKLKAQEKRVDHLERAKRKEEIPLLMEAIQQVKHHRILILNHKLSSETYNPKNINKLRFSKPRNYSSEISKILTVLNATLATLSNYLAVNEISHN